MFGALNRKQALFGWLCLATCGLALSHAHAQQETVGNVAGNASGTVAGNASENGLNTMAIPSTPLPDAPATAGKVHGTVVDANNDVVAGADVVLLQDPPAQPLRTQTDSDGRFEFATVPAGHFRLNVTIKGLRPGSFAGVLRMGENFEVPTIKLNVATVEADVDVIASQQDLAEAEIKVEEHQRVAGFLPNFFVSYDFNAAPLTTRQKFELAWKNASDPANFLVSAGVAGVQQANDDFKGYGYGAAGYGKRFGAASGDLIFGTFIGGAILPAVFHQDPRYFYKGTGTVKERLWYALSRTFVQKGDNGKWQPAYSSMIGDLSAGAISNLYYPAANRTGATLTIEEGLLNIAGDGLGNVVQEFVIKHLTPHAPTYGNLNP